MTVVDNVHYVQDQISNACARSNRSPDEVKLVAVSKQKPAADILAAAAAGLQHFGENRVEEAETKIPEVLSAAGMTLTWHMIGHIQSRKARKVPHWFQVIHSVDSVKLAQKLAQFVEEDKTILKVLLQVNVSGEETKGGFEASGWRSDSHVRDVLWQEVGQIINLPGLDIQGLMTMAPMFENAEAARPVFAGLAELRDELERSFKITLPELSMGMTDDFPVAIEEGATLVRIGRAIFGKRNQ